MPGQVRLISLSFDPDHDTPDVLRKHAQIRGAAPPLWSYAVASHDELAKIAAPLGLFYGPGKDEIAHNLCTAVIDRAGKLARLEVGTAAQQMGDHRASQDNLFSDSSLGELRSGSLVSVVNLAVALWLQRSSPHIFGERSAGRFCRPVRVMRSARSNKCDESKR